MTTAATKPHRPAQLHGHKADRQHVEERDPLASAAASKRSRKHHGEQPHGRRDRHRPPAPIRALPARRSEQTLLLWPATVANAPAAKNRGSTLAGRGLADADARAARRPGPTREGFERHGSAAVSTDPAHPGEARVVDLSAVGREMATAGVTGG